MAQYNCVLVLARAATRRSARLFLLQVFRGLGVFSFRLTLLLLKCGSNLYLETNGMQRESFWGNIGQAT